MLEICNLTHGEILNRFHGTETPDALKIKVMGLARAEDKVTVNGIPAERCGESFCAGIELKQLYNEIRVSAEGNRGTAERTIKVLWDKNSFKRINFCIDDHAYVFSEIAEQRPGSLFDHFYFRNLRALHEKYGLRLTLNLFYEDMRNGFTLDRFPDCYKAEFQANSEWLKLAFHAKSEFPDRIYQNAETETVMHDYDLVSNEIRRFAGEETLIAPANVHWSMVKPEVLPELRKRGVRFQGGLFLNGQTRIGEKASEQVACDVGYFENEENSLFLQQRHLWHDFRCDITMGTECVVVNLEEMPVLEQKLRALFSKPGNDALHMLTHEQYSFPFYANYLPDHFDRMALMCRLAIEYGYKFVFFNEGFLGNGE